MRCIFQKTNTLGLSLEEMAPRVGQGTEAGLETGNGTLRSRGLHRAGGIWIRGEGWTERWAHSKIKRWTDRLEHPSLPRTHLGHMRADAGDRSVHVRVDWLRSTQEQGDLGCVAHSECLALCMLDAVMGAAVAAARQRPPGLAEPDLQTGTPWALQRTTVDPSTTRV